MTRNTRHRFSWFILLIVVLASVAGPLNRFKTPPAFRTLMKTFALPLGRAGPSMSVSSFAGLLLAIPGGFIFQQLGTESPGSLPW